MIDTRWRVPEFMKFIGILIVKLEEEIGFAS